MTTVLLSPAAASRIGSRVAELNEQVCVVELRDAHSPEELAGIDVAYFSIDLWPNGNRALFGAARRAPGLRWFHTMSAGVDRDAYTDLVRRGVILTTSSGASAIPIAHTVTMFVLAFNKNLSHWQDAQRRHAWEPHLNDDLIGAKVVIVGMGPIGFEVAKVMTALATDPVGIRRQVRGDEPCRTRAFEHLDDELRTADHVIVALPLTADTRLLFNETRLAVIKAGATFINVGRGELVDEPSLVTALSNGQLSYAGLDVFTSEPLDPQSPLWDMPNVIITPHNSSSSPTNMARIDDIFLDNLRLFENGAPLRNVATLD